MDATESGPPEGVAEAPPPPPASATQPAGEKPKDNATPIYKKWWFWVVLGVGALVVINIAVDDSSSSQPGQPNGLLLPESAPGIPEGGATLWRF